MKTNLANFWHGFTAASIPALQGQADRPFRFTRSGLFHVVFGRLLGLIFLLHASGMLMAGPIQPVADPLPSGGSFADSVVRDSSAVAGIGALPTEPLAPGVVTTIEGINFDQDAAAAGFYHIPPDPTGTCGPSHVVSVTNTAIRWHTKAGVQQNSATLASFFAPLTPVNGTFDPKVIYDSQAGRFVVVSLEKRDTANGDAVNSSRILIAVSDDSDPNGAWYYLAINSLTNIGGVDRWADYPGVGVDEEAIYITNNMFGFGAGGTYGGSRLWIVNKTPLYTGGAGTFTIQNPFASGGSATTSHPANIIGTPPTGATGTFLVSYSGISDGTNEYIQIVRVDNPLTVPTFNVQQLNVGDIDNTAAAYPNAPQSGSVQLINTGDRRTMNAIWRNNRLYTAATTVPGSGTNVGQVTARFWQLNTTTVSSISLVQSAAIGGEEIAAGASTFYPTIAVNAGGDICVGFAASAPTIFPGAYAVTRLVGDALNTVRPALTVAAGTDYYYRAFGGTRNRWGDYSGTSVDPANDSDFWVFNQYAMTRGTVLGGFPTEDGRWATRWAKIDATWSPTLTAPASNSNSGSSVAVNFTLPEAALAGSVTLAFTGPATRTLTLAASQETGGIHSFSFNPANPTATAAVAGITGGASIPDGTYTVTLSYNDTIASGAATALSTNVSIDATTQTPGLTLPATNATVGNPVGVSFLLPEAALGSSVKLILSGPAGRTLNLAASQETSGAHSFTFNPANPTATAAITSITGGATIPDGTYTVTLQYQDALGNAAASAASTNVTIDTVTAAPVLTAPVTNAITGSPVAVSFSLPETALASSVKVVFSGPAGRTLNLAASQETSGAHSFTFNPANPTATAAITSITGGAAIPDGTYTVTLQYQDALGNAAASAASTNVTIDTVTAAPVLTAPVTNAITGSPVAVSFSLPETAQAGSVKLTFTGAAGRTLNLAASQETSGAHSFSFNPANPAAAANVAGIVGGASIPDGTYAVTLSYQDVLGNGAATAVSTNVQIDTTAPTLNLPAPITVTATSPTGAVVNYSFTPTDPGGSGIATSGAIPASGTTFPIGTTTVNATATDNAGNIANGSFTITVNPNPPPTGGTLTINPSTGVHQGDLITLSAAGWTDPDLPLTYQFFNGVTALNSPGAASSLNINAPLPGGYTIKVRVTDSAGSFTDATQPLTVVPFTAVETWRQFYFGDYHNTGNGADNFDFDSDGVKNGAEFAFGTNPTSGLSGPPFLQYAGTFAGGGGVVSTGQPKPAFESIPIGVDFRILFNRRVDYVAAGITYIPEFSADGITWFPSAVEPAVLANNGTMQVVSVPYPRFVGGKKARFAHVIVVVAP